MLSRALSLATVTLLIGCLAAIPVRAQNLEAGKSASQIFAGTCSACHKSPRGLLRTVPAGSLPGFLRQHYTTSSDMASSLGGFLISNGATDTRVGSKPTEQPKGAKPPEGAKPAEGAKPPEQLDRFGRPLRPAAPSQEAAKPEAQPQQAARPDPGAPWSAQGRNAKRLARPGEAPDAAKPGVEGQAPVPGQAASERGPDGRKLTARHRRGRPGSDELPKTDAAKDEPAKGEPATDDASRSETAKVETGSKPENSKSEGSKSEGAKSEGANPSGDGKPDSAASKESSGGETTALRADPVPPVTPAPKSTDTETRPVQTATPLPGASGTGPAASTESAAPAAPPPAVTASVPPLPPVAPAGPPTPPISQ